MNASDKIILRYTQPCSVAWEDLVGDDRRRYCSTCQQYVYNLEVLGPEDLVQTIKDTEGQFQGHLYGRPFDLKVVVTQPCKEANTNEECPHTLTGSSLLA